MIFAELAPLTPDNPSSTLSWIYCEKLKSMPTNSLANSVCNGVVYGNTGWSYHGDFGNDTLAYAFSISTDQGSLTQNSATFDLSPTQAFPAAVPEPASASLFLIAGASLLLRRAWLRLL